MDLSIYDILPMNLPMHYLLFGPYPFPVSTRPRLRRLGSKGIQGGAADCSTWSERLGTPLGVTRRSSIRNKGVTTYPYQMNYQNYQNSQAYISDPYSLYNQNSQGSTTHSNQPYYQNRQYNNSNQYSGSGRRQ